MAQKAEVGARERPTLPRSIVEHHRRLRAASGAAEIAHEFGLGAITVSGICELCQMARNSFYEVFGGVEDCLRFGAAEGFEAIFAGVREASAAETAWPARLNAGVTSFYAGAAAEPLLAEFCLVHSFGIGGAAPEHGFEAGVVLLAELLADGRQSGGTELPAPPTAEEYLARMMISLASLTLRSGAADTLPAHRREMVVLALNTFYGPDGAARVWRELEAETSSASPRGR